MSHFNTLVLVPSSSDHPIVSAYSIFFAEGLLSPFNSNIVVPDYSSIRLRSDGVSEKYISNWNVKSRFDYYELGGRWDGDITNNMCPVEEVTGYLAFAIVTPDGTWHSQKDQKDETEWPAQCRLILEHYVTYVAVLFDLHI